MGYNAKYKGPRPYEYQRYPDHFVKGAPPDSLYESEPQSPLLAQLLAWSVFLLILILLAWLVVRLSV